MILRIKDSEGNIQEVLAIKGEPGTNGKSAYQYAQEGGFTGSEQEFAEQLAKLANLIYDGTVRTE